MITPEKLFQEIQNITSELISVGVCVDQNFPSIRKDMNGEVHVEFSGKTTLSSTLRNVPYGQSYEELLANRSYNMKLLDGGLIQILYHFSGDGLKKHRLAFFPSPDLLDFQSNRELYEDDELYADIVAKNIVTVPVRFDFDLESFVENEHPKSHLTLGQYKNCRIPVSAPLTPFYFTSFILRSFYNTPFVNFCSSIRPSVPRFDSTIADGEIDQIYVHVCGSPQS